MPSIDEITNGIFIGNVYSVIGNPTTGDKNLLVNMDVVISVLSEEEYVEYFTTETLKISEICEKGIEWHRFVIDDRDSEPINQYFYEIHEIISKTEKENKNILIHCAAGISRSPTLVIAYLMIENKWTAEEAIAFVKTKRDVEPNKGFQRQLQGLSTVI